MRLAYMAVTFPCLRQTFVLREIRHLREHGGFDVFFVYAYQHPRDDDVDEENTKLVKDAVYFKERYATNLMAFFLECLSNPVGVARVLRLWAAEVTRLNLRTNIMVLAHVFTAFGVARRARHDRIDQIHAHFATASTIALVVHVLTGISFSFTAHACGDIYVYSPFLFEKLKRARRIVAISEYNRKYLDLISGYTLEASRVAVVYNGVETPNKPVGHASADVPFIFTCAAFVEPKGYGTLLAALKLLKETGVIFRFQAVGGGPLYKRMLRRVEELGLSKEVNLMGPQPFSVVTSLLRQADIFVLAAEIGLDGQRDGMPTAITEAMAYGLPVVATRVSGIPEQVCDGVNGFLVDERDETEFASKLKTLIEDPGLRAKMGARSDEITRAKFHMETNLKRLAEVLRG